LHIRATVTLLGRHNDEITRPSVPIQTIPPNKNLFAPTRPPNCPNVLTADLCKQFANAVVVPEGNSSLTFCPHDSFERYSVFFIAIATGRRHPRKVQEHHGPSYHRLKMPIVMPRENAIRSIIGSENARSDVNLKRQGQPLYYW
jgi:hypothetical protein